jgi:hypothetical protein
MIAPDQIDQIKENMEIVGNDGLHLGLLFASKPARLDLQRMTPPTGCGISSRPPMSNMLTTASISTEAALARRRNGVDDWQ